LFSYNYESSISEKPAVLILQAYFLYCLSIAKENNEDIKEDFSLNQKLF
jgi:hypothetical protein